MAVPTVESVTVTTGDSTVITADMPTTRPDDDLYIILVACDDDDDGLTDDSGNLTNLGGILTTNNQCTLAAYYRIGSSEPSSYTFSDIGVVDEQYVCAVYRISGINTTTPIHNHGTDEYSTNTPDAPSVTATINDTLRIYACAQDSADGDNMTTYPSGTIGHNTAFSKGGSGDVGAASVYGDGPTSGNSTGVGSFEFDSGYSDAWAAITILVAPAATSSVSVSVPSVALSLAPQAPTVLTPRTVSVPAATLTLAAFVPTASVTDHQLATVPSVSLTLGALVPTVIASGHQTVSVPAASVSLTPQTPTVTTTDYKTISVPSVSLTLTPSAPTVDNSLTFTLDTGDTLLNGLCAYWKLDESSGDRAETIHAIANLSPQYVTSPPGSATAKQNDGVDLENTTDTQYLDASSTAADALAVGDFDFTWAGWVKFESFIGNDRILSMWETDASSHTFQLFRASADGKLKWQVTGPSGDGNATADNLGVASTGTWYFIEVWHDASSNEVGIRINNGTADTTSTTYGAKTTVDTFYFGAYNSGGAGIDGIADEWGYWKRLLTSTERGDLYNSGAGNTIVVSVPQSVSVPAGSLTLSPQVPTVDVTENQFISVPVVSLSLTTQAPTVVTSDHQLISVPLSTLSLAALVPTVSTTDHQSVATPAASLSLTTLVPTVSLTEHITIAVPAVSLSLAAQAPVVSISGNQSIDVPSVSLSLSAQVPTVTATVHQTISVPLVSLSLTAQTPTITVTALVSIPTTALSLTTAAPTVATTADVALPLATLTLTTYAPTVSALVPQTISVPTGALSITTYSPTIYRGAVCSTGWSDTAEPETSWDDESQPTTTWDDYPTCTGT